MSDGPLHLTLAGLKVELDDLVPRDHCYFVGPRALVNLQAAEAMGDYPSAYDEWLADGSLVVVKLEPQSP